MEHDANGFYWSWTRDGYADISVGDYFETEDDAWRDAEKDYIENGVGGDYDETE
jgi:hypothetical protein